MGVIAQRDQEIATLDAQISRMKIEHEHEKNSETEEKNSFQTSIKKNVDVVRNGILDKTWDHIQICNDGTPSSELGRQIKAKWQKGEKINFEEYNCGSFSFRKVKKRVYAEEQALEKEREMNREL